MTKKLAIWGSIAFLIFFIAYRPASVADVFYSIGGTVTDIASGLYGFFEDLIS